MISPALACHGQAIWALFAAEKDNSGKMSWYRYQFHRRRTEQWAVYHEGDQVLGFVHWAMKVDNTRVIYDLVVDETHRLKGIGRQLVRHVGSPVMVRSTHEFFNCLGFRGGYYEKEPIVVDVNQSWILSYTGKAINPLNMRAEDICIEDIAHALACVNRFAGHTAKPITVAQHSVYVSRVVGDARHPLALQALLHDASEAYLGDVTKWLKPHMPAYVEAENRLERLIYEKFGCPLSMCEEVARADRVMVMYEAPRGFGKAWDGLHLQQRPGYEPITPGEMERIGKWAVWNWRASEEAFLVRYRACTAK